MKLRELLKFFWDDYIDITPVAHEVHKLLKERGERITNDHIAFRTFSHSDIGLDVFENFFKVYGYVKSGEYNFELKKLNAIHLENIIDPSLPKIFISELRYKELSENSISIIEREITRIKGLSLEELFAQKDIFKVSSIEYKELISESEYAGWLCALGLRANHFTVFVNDLKSITGLDELNKLLINKNIPLNKSGGIIKGSPSEYLEQTSTMANKREIKFTDKTMSVPTCYYEFARRYNMPSGELFHGFVTQSADKIFESTDNELVK